MNSSIKNKVAAAGLSLVMAVSGMASVASVPVFADDTASYVPVAADTTEVKAYMADSDNSTVLVDARLVDAYQGWALDGAARGGHLKNSVSVPAQSITDPVNPNKNEGTTVEQYQDQTLKEAGLDSSKSVIVYDTNDEDAAVVARYLVEKKGYAADKVKIYNAASLINSGKAKVVKYPNYKLYVPAQVVKNISDVETGKTQDYTSAAASIVNGDDVVILDVSWGDETSDPNTGSGYDAGHVPGAIHVNTDEYETPREYVESKAENYRTEWRLNSDEELIKMVGSKGITKDSCVIITGYEPMATTRMGIILKYLGVENVHVMSCGTNGWDAEGYGYEEGINKPVAVDLGITKPQNPDVIDTIDEVKKEIKDTANYVVVDTRTEAEWNGTSSGYGYHDLKGRIDGTVWGPCGLGYSSSVYNYRNADKSMKSAEALEALWASQGIDSSKQMVFFCGSGWRVAETCWDAWVIGREASIYSDGWIGWSNEGNPYLRDGKTYEMDKATGKEVNISAIKSSKPSGVKASAGKKSAKIQWKSSADVTKFVVYKSTKKSSGFKAVVTTASKSATVKSLKKGKRYYFKVVGYKSINGSKVYSKTSSVVSAVAK